MIRFLLDVGDGRTEEIALGDDVPADLTVLDWLRLHRGLIGTKEGCGSGDCGACTVVVASPIEDVVGPGSAGTERVEGGEGDAGRTPDERDVAVVPGVAAREGAGRHGGALAPVLRHESVNACIAFVGALHGRLLVTVESLARGDTLHPVQRAMVDEHGSQCGFCTPGFVMSLYALYRAPDAPAVTFADRTGSEAGGSGSTDGTRPADLDEPTPVVAYRSAANAEAARPEVADTGVADTTGGGDGHGGTRRSMTMAAGWLDGLSTDDADALSHRVDRALGGNLCRCTGYRPIKRAAAVALAARPDEREAEASALERERAIAERLREIAAVPPAHAGFHAPDSLDAFATLVARYPDAPLLGGGTDLALEVTQRLRDLPRLIHVARVPELARVTVDEDGTLELGAAVSLTRCRELLGERVPGAAELLLRFGSDPIRNRGTIGGNLASASPIGDLPPLLLALDATLVLQKGGDVRELPLEDFFTGYRETRLERGEFVRAVRVPPLGRHDVCAVYKVSKRMEDDISAVCGAFRLTLDGDLGESGFRGDVADGHGDGLGGADVPDGRGAGVSRGRGAERTGDAAQGSSDLAKRSGGRRIVAARVAFGGMAATPARARGTEAALVGQPFERAAIETAGAALDDDFTPMSDARASAGYRARVARNLLLRTFLEAGGSESPVRLSLADSPGVAPGASA